MSPPERGAGAAVVLVAASLGMLVGVVFAVNGHWYGWAGVAAGVTLLLLSAAAAVRAFR